MPAVSDEIKRDQETRYDVEQKGNADEFKMNCETTQREEQISTPCRPQRKIKLPERFRDYVIE